MTDHEHEGMKKCTKCGEIKPATAEYFNRDRTKKDGIRTQCRECRREYYQKNKDRRLEYWREYYQKNKDRKLEYWREYWREYHREYRRAPVGRLEQSISRLRRKTGATIYVRDMTEEQKETLANQYVAVRTLEKTERELLAASGKRRCSKCGGVFDFEMFYKERGRYMAVCRACKGKRGRKYDRKYRQQNKDKINEYNREYYQQNKDKINERKRQARQKTKNNLTKQNLSPIIGCR